MLVLDANILVRAVLGSRVPVLLHKYAGQTEFFAPDTAFEEARKVLPAILEKCKVPVAPAMAALDSLGKLVHVVDLETYAPFEGLARERLVGRDEDDWPALACALALEYRSGLRTWTSSVSASRLGPPIMWSCTWPRPCRDAWRDLSSARGAARGGGFDEFMNISLVVSSILGCHSLFLPLTPLFRETKHRSCRGRTSRSGTAVVR